MHGTNPLRKREWGDGSVLWVQEVFDTIQGEGPLAGEPAVFIRLAGCNLACFFCDTEFESSSWNPTIDEISERVKSISSDRPRVVVLTGGEPFRQNIIPLVQKLNSCGYSCQVETAGTLFHPGIPLVFPTVDERKQYRHDLVKKLNTIVCSPKTGKVNAKLEPYIHAYKYIIWKGGTSDKDGLPCFSTQKEGALMLLARPPRGVEVFVQPCDEENPTRNAENIDTTVQVAMKHGYRLSLQTHKILGVA